MCEEIYKNRIVGDTFGMQMSMSRKMKRILALLFAVTTMFAFATCAAADNSTQNAGDNANSDEQSIAVPSDPSGDNGNEAEGSSILVAYYSASGNTGRVAAFIADELKADTFELIPAEPYSDADLDWTDRSSRVNKEHDDASLQDIGLVSTEVPDWSNYDVVLFGYPIWWREASWVVNNFIKDNDFTGKTVIPFCTSTSSDLGESGTNLEKMAGTGIWLEGRRFNENPDEDSVREWVRGLDLE